MSILTRLALLFGGASPEHEISIRSAKNIFEAIPHDLYEVTLIGISPSGKWYHIEDPQFFQSEKSIQDAGQALGLVPGADHHFFYLENGQEGPTVDVVFPITHGPNGEDGTLQGILRHLNLPFVGPDVLGSAVAMDKDVAKRLLRDADLKVAEGLTFYYYEKDSIDFFAVANQLGLPIFIKPANMGSSVGVAKAANKEAFDQAIQHAFQFDHKIIIEEAIIGREVECAVMGNGTLATTTVGEIRMGTGFYDYDAKYENEVDAQLDIPAQNLDDELLAKLTLVARHAYRALNCEGMSRVDMFLTAEGAVYVNEINTLPGFTSISMYPALWANAGMSYSELIHELIQLAIERGERTQQLQRGRS
ncbi:MAG: D-alanine--D-alanine ligase family protein [Bacteroidota bacterium]